MRGLNARSAGRLAAVALAAVPVAGGNPASALAAPTAACPGSLTENGRYRADERGLLRDYYIRGGSCPAARKLIRHLDDDAEGGYFGREGSVIGRAQVPGGSAWKCRVTFTVDGKRRPLTRIDPKKAKVIVESLSCRPLSGRLNRRVTARTRNIRDLLVEDSAGSARAAGPGPR